MATVEVAVPFTDRWYFSALLAGIREALDAAGHRPRLIVRAPSPTARAEAASELTRGLGDEDVLGGIVAGFHLDAAQARAALAPGRPLVSIGGAQPGFPTVMIDDIGAARTATEHLLKLGHRRVLHLAGEREAQMDFAVHGRRRKGYEVAMTQAGLEPDSVEVPFDAAAARAAAAQVLARPDRPTAVFAVSDEMALAVLDAVRDAGLEPGEDVSVVGFDDHPLAEAAGLTTMRQDPAGLGELAVRLLLDRAADGGQGDHGSRLVQTPLVERGSTRRPSLARAFR